MIQYYLNIAGIMVFAISGAIAAIQSKKEIDIIGVVVLGVVTATGGGTIRDVILNLPVFWVSQPDMLAAAVIASIVTFFFHDFFQRRMSIIKYYDAMGIALLTVSVINKVTLAGFNSEIAIFMGVLTGIGGGLIRDVLSDRPNLLFSKELYATPIIVGAILYVAMIKAFPGSPYVQLGAVLFIFLFRTAAIRFNLTLPRWLIASGTV